MSDPARIVIVHVCPQCDGWGKWGGEDCDRCKGRGQLAEIDYSTLADARCIVINVDELMSVQIQAYILPKVPTAREADIEGRLEAYLVRIQALEKSVNVAGSFLQEYEKRLDELELLRETGSNG